MKQIVVSKKDLNLYFKKAKQKILTIIVKKMKKT